MAGLSLMTLDLFLPGGLIEPEGAWLGNGPHSLERARTAAFTVLVLTQRFNCSNARSETTSALRAAFSNRWIWGTVALSTALQVAVVDLPFLNLALSTVPICACQWCVCGDGKRRCALVLRRAEAAAANLDPRGARIRRKVSSEVRVHARAGSAWLGPRDGERMWVRRVTVLRLPGCARGPSHHYCFA